MNNGKFMRMVGINNLRQPGEMHHSVYFCLFSPTYIPGACNKACSGWWGFCRIFKHFAKRGFEFSLLPSIVHAR
jgi:hypothetical protein